jgi:hypothetical protein
MFYTDGHDGGWERVFIQASVSGCPEREDLWVGIDGRELDWFPTGNDDRRFLEWNSEEGFAPGFHVIEFRQLTEAKKGRMPRQLCSIEIIEYGQEEEYHLEKVFKFGATRLILRDGLGISRRTIFMGGRHGDPRTKAVSCDICRRLRFVLSVKKVFGQISWIDWYPFNTFSSDDSISSRP